MNLPVVGDQRNVAQPVVVEVGDYRAAEVAAENRAQPDFHARGAIQRPQPRIVSDHQHVRQGVGVQVGQDNGAVGQDGKGLGAPDDFLGQTIDGGEALAAVGKYHIHRAVAVQVVCGERSPAVDGLGGRRPSARLLVPCLFNEFQLRGSLVERHPVDTRPAEGAQGEEAENGSQRQAGAQLVPYPPDARLARRGRVQLVALPET